jgi:hypothetical protein
MNRSHDTGSIDSSSLAQSTSIRFSSLSNNKKKLQTSIHKQVDIR